MYLVFHRPVMNRDFITYYILLSYSFDRFSRERKKDELVCIFFYQAMHALSMFT